MKPNLKDGSEAVNGLASLLQLWQDRQTITQQSFQDSQGMNVDDLDEDEDYAADDFWRQVELLVEKAAAEFYHDNHCNTHTQKKRTKMGSKRKNSYGLHTVLRLANQLVENDMSHKEKHHNMNDNLASALTSFGLWQYPQDVTLRDPDGRLPLHIAVKMRPLGANDNKVNVISALLDLHPQAAECIDPNTIPQSSHQQHVDEDEDENQCEQEYPLHTALKHGHSWRGGVGDLVEQCNDALVIPHATSGLYPYQMAAAVASDADLDTIYHVLRAQPGVVQSKHTQEQDLGLLVLSMQQLEDGIPMSREEREQVLMYLTSDDEESLPGRPRESDGDYDEEEKIKAMQDYGYQNDYNYPPSLDGSNHSRDDDTTGQSTTTNRPKRKRRGRRNSFVSFDDQAQILQQAADVYQRRKENGFRDLGLLEHIDNCKETRATLRHIGDPEALRKKKIADFIEEFRRTKPRGKQTHGLSEYEVRERLAALRKVQSPRKDKDDAEQNKDDTASPIAKMRAQLRSADAPRSAVSPPHRGKKWTPPMKKNADDRFGPVTPLNCMFGSPKKTKNITDRLGARAQYTNVAIASPPINSLNTEFQKDPTQVAFSGTIVSVKGAESTVVEEDIKEGPPSPMQIQREKLRSVHKTKIIQREITKPVGEEQESPLSPHLQQRRRLRPTQAKSKQPTEAISLAEETSLSPHQILRQRLRPTQTNPRKYQSSVRNIEAYERKSSMDTNDSNLPLSSESLSEQSETNFKSTNTIGPCASADRSKSTNNQTGDAMEPDHVRSEPLKNEQDTDALELESLEDSTEGEPEGIVEKVSPTPSIQNEGSLVDSVLSNKSCSDRMASSSQDQDIHVEEVTEEPKIGEPLFDTLPPSSNTLMSKVTTFFPGLGAMIAKPIDETPSTSVQQAADGPMQTESAMEMDDSIQTIVHTKAEVEANEGKEKPHRGLPEASRRRIISSDAVLRKRAEIEIRDQVKKTQTRLRQYRERRQDTCHRHTLYRKRRTNRLDKVSSALFRAQESVSKKAFDTAEYESAIMEATIEEKDDLGDETRTIEADLVKQMHCMLALEKQESLFRQHLGKTVAYLRRCKQWLQDFDAVAGLLGDVEAQNCAMFSMYESTLRQHQVMIEKYSTILA